MNKKQDRRVKRTQQVLTEALLKLLSEKDIERITIQELADVADVHRSTFYAHYADIFDLRDQLEAEAIADLTEALSKNSEGSYDDVYNKLIDYLWDHQAIVKVLFLPKSSSFAQAVTQLLEDRFLAIWKEEEPGIDMEEDAVRYYATFQVGGFLAAVYRWTKEGFVLSRKEFIRIMNLDECE